MATASTSRHDPWTLKGDTPDFRAGTATLGDPHKRNARQCNWVCDVRDFAEIVLVPMGVQGLRWVSISCLRQIGSRPSMGPNDHWPQGHLTDTLRHPPTSPRNPTPSDITETHCLLHVVLNMVPVLKDTTGWKPSHWALDQRIDRAQRPATPRAATTKAPGAQSRSHDK